VSHTQDPFDPVPTTTLPSEFVAIAIDDAQLAEAVMWIRLVVGDQRNARLVKFASQEKPTTTDPSPLTS
jgi:hypothetical protein